MNKTKNNDTNSRSWFCVFNNPADHGYSGAPNDVLKKLRDEWITGSDTRSGAWIYCISAEGLHHIHMVLEDTKSMRFTAVKKSYAKGMHFEPTRGNKKQVEDYINKRGAFEEKGEKIVDIITHGDIKGAPSMQGKRSDLELAKEMIDSGMTPKQILNENPKLYRSEKYIKRMYADKKEREIPLYRDVKVYWHIGKSGSGKTRSSNDIISKNGEENVYMLGDFRNGGLDNYNYEPILFMDEFRGLTYHVLLQMLDGQKMALHARYQNIMPAWQEVHITSVLTPADVYKNMVDYDQRKIDPIDQFERRIDFIVYHFKHNGQYYSYELPYTEYRGIDDLITRAVCHNLDESNAEKYFALDSLEAV